MTLAHTLPYHRRTYPGSESGEPSMPRRWTLQVRLGIGLACYFSLLVLFHLELQSPAAALTGDTRIGGTISAKTILTTSSSSSVGPRSLELVVEAGGSSSESDSVDLLSSAYSRRRRPNRQSQSPTTYKECTESGSANSDIGVTDWMESNSTRSITAMTSFRMLDLEPISRLLASLSGDRLCVRSIYDQEPSSSDTFMESPLHIQRPDENGRGDTDKESEKLEPEPNCRIWTTQQPFLTTHATLTEFRQAIVVVRDPIYVIVDGFQRDYQTSLGPQLVTSPLFMQYAKAKAFLWRWHLQYWYGEMLERRQHGAGDARFLFVRIEDLLRDATSVIGQLREFFGQPAASSLPCTVVQELDGIVGDLSVEYERMEELQAMLPVELHQYIVEETWPFLCHFGYEPCRTESSSETANEDRPIALLPSKQDRHLLRNGDRWWEEEPGEPREVHVITTYFEASQPERQVELDEALSHTVQHPDISRVHIWMDGEGGSTSLPVEEGSKYATVHSEQQPLYADLFAFANTHLQDQIVIVQNADISWTMSSIRNLHSLHRGMIYSLSRHTNHSDYPATQCETTGGHNRNLCTHYSGSHDSFAFIPPIDPLLLRQFTFKQNTWGAENVLIEAFRHGGFLVENPCMDVVSVHFHCSGVRRNTGRKVWSPSKVGATGGVGVGAIGASAQERQDRIVYRAYPKSLDTICAQAFCHSVQASPA